MIFDIFKKAIYSKPSKEQDIISEVRKKSLENAKILKTDLLEADYPHSCCSECAKYRGRWFSISGRDKRFPNLPKEYECNCSGLIFYPVIYGVSNPNIEWLLKEKVDVIQFSNRPFIDDRSDEEKENHRKYVECCLAN